MANNTPYDKFAHDILTASGSNVANPPAAYFKVLRTPDAVMENTTQLFLAIRFNCNKCHDHPFERWTQDQYYQLAAYFASVDRKEDPKYKGQISIPNNPIQIADAALYLSSTKPSLGITDPYELTQEQFDATIDLLKQQKPLVKLYWVYDTDARSAFANGDISLAAAWPVDTLNLQKKNVPVGETKPAKVTGWADTWMIAKRAPHPNCAYMWMKYASTPKVQAQQALIFGETPVNPKACPIMNKMEPGSCSKYHLDEQFPYYDSIKFWKTPIADCGNGEKNCIDYNEWQKAWTQVTG